MLGQPSSTASASEPDCRDGAAWFSTLLSTPQSAARSESSIPFCP